MSTRISTGMMYSQSVSTMLAKQAKLAHLQEQISTGQKLVTAKDDPVGAGTAVGLDRALASLEQFETNANTVQNRLNMQENALAQAGDLLQRANDLAVQANNGVLSDEDRQAIAAELSTIRESLLSLANSTDGTGRYLFGGTTDASAPFSTVNGEVVYSGDQTQKKVEIAADTFVSDALPGSEIFMRIRTGDGSVDAQAASGNSGTGVLAGFGRSASAGSWDGSSYSVQFTTADSYEVLDASGSVVASGSYTDGDSIAFAGLTMTISGAPAAGDSFTIGAAGTQDVFSSIDALVDALNMDTLSDSDQAAQRNALQASMRNITQATNTMIDARASGGAQLAAIDTATELRAANEVTLKTSLSAIRDLDYAEAIGQYELEQTALQAAQTIFTQMQGMSLFDKLG